MKVNKEDQARSLTMLRDWLKPGDTVYTMLGHVSASGMSRNIIPFVIRGGEPVNIGGMVSNIQGRKWNNDGSVTIKGCGMDMGFALVYELSQAIFPDGFDDGAEHKPNGGYALKHRWL